MGKLISLVLLILLTFQVQAKGIIAHLLERDAAISSIDQIPCIEEANYQHLKSLLNFSDESLEGSLCGDGSDKEFLGRVLNMFWGEVENLLTSVRNNPEEALADPDPYYAYKRMSCMKLSLYQEILDSLGFDDSFLPGTDECDDSLRARFRKIMLHFYRSYTYYKRGFDLHVYGALTNPYDLFVTDFQHVMEYKGSITPGEDAPAMEGATTYDKLPCVSEEMYEELKIAVGVDDKNLDGDLCGDDSNKERFGKLLLYMRNLAVKLPRGWKGGASDALSNPLKYVANGTHGDISFKDESGAAIASNFFGQITIYKLFFTQDPLDAIGTLIHEARHSDSNDPRHEKCTAGDRARQSGACDAWLDTGSKAGAYSYNVSFYYGLAKHGLNSQVSQEDREKLRSWALSLISRRFNAVPDFLGLPFETAYMLSSGGRLYYLHPIFKKRIEVEVGIDGMEKIEFNRVRNGLFIYNEQGQVFQNKDFFGEFTLYDENIVDPEKPVKDITRLTEKSASQTYFVTEDNVIRNRVFDLDQQIYVSEVSPFQSFEDPITSLIHGNVDKRYALAESGTLLEIAADKDMVEGESNMAKDSFQDPKEKGWVHVVGGLLYNKLFGVNEDGELYYQNGETPEKIELGQNISEYQETSNFAMIKRSEWSVDIKRYGEEKSIKFEFKADGYGSYENPSIKAIGFTRYFKPGKRYGHAVRIDQDFIDKCEVVKSDIDPWTGRGMGITKYNELVFQGDRFSPCMLYEKHGTIEVADFRFAGTSIQEQGVFSNTYLEILTDGKWRKIYPYDWREMPVD